MAAKVPDMTTTMSTGTSHGKIGSIVDHAGAKAGPSSGERAIAKATKQPQKKQETMNSAASLVLSWRMRTAQTAHMKPAARPIQSPMLLGQGMPDSLANMTYMPASPRASVPQRIGVTASPRTMRASKVLQAGVK